MYLCVLSVYMKEENVEESPQHRNVGHLASGFRLRELRADP